MRWGLVNAYFIGLHMSGYKIIRSKIHIWQLFLTTWITRSACFTKEVIFYYYIYLLLYIYLFIYYIYSKISPNTYLKVDNKIRFLNSWLWMNCCSKERGRSTDSKSVNMQVKTTQLQPLPCLRTSLTSSTEHSGN